MSTTPDDWYTFINFGLWAKDKHGNANKNVNDNANVNANLLRVMDNMVFKM